MRSVALLASASPKTKLELHNHERASVEVLGIIWGVYRGYIGVV